MEPEAKITITQSDLNEEEKVSTFIRLFSRQHLRRAKDAMSKQKFGEGEIEKLQTRMSRLDLNDPEDFQLYEVLRDKLKAQADSLQDNPVYQMPLYDDDMNRLLQNREVAEEYLGPVRYVQAAFGKDAPATDKELRKWNPAIAEFEKQKKHIRVKLEELEEERKELEKRQKEMGAEAKAG